jgi:dihydrofolate reductase
MRVSFIVAKSENNVIGKNNKLPWHLKDDLQNFKKITMGHHILMGRKTYESIGKPLPGRMSLVLSNDPKAVQEQVVWFQSIWRALKYAERAQETELFVIGGAGVFKSALSICDRIYLTEIHSQVEGDVYFPQLSLKNWKLLSEQKFDKNKDNDYDFTIQVLDRR